MCYWIFRFFVVGCWQIFFQQFQCLQSLIIREFRCQYRNISFYGVSYCVQIIESIQGFWYVYNQVGVDNCYIWSQCIVCQWIFLISSVVSYNCKWSDFRICIRSGGDSDYFCFYVYFWEFVDMFMDIYKVQRQLFEVSFWMFVYNLYDFCGVYWGIIIQCDNYVWFEGVCQFCIFMNDVQGWVCFYFEEDFSFNVCCFQYGSDLISIIIVEQEVVSYDECMFVVISNYFIQCDWQGVMVEVDRFWKFVL